VLEAELDNLRAAFDRLVAAGEGEPALRLSTALGRFWTERGYIVEARRRFEVALPMVPEHGLLRARGLLAAAPQAHVAGDIQTFRAWATEGLAIAQEIGDAWGTAYGKFALAIVLVESDDLASAMPLVEQAIVDFESVGDDHMALVAMTNAAALSGELGNHARERTLFMQALELARRNGNVRVEARALQLLGYNALRSDDFVAAAPSLADGLRVFNEVGEVAEVLGTLIFTGHCLALAGHIDSAALLVYVAQRELERLEIVDRSWTSTVASTLGVVNASLTDDAIANAQSRASSTDVSAAVEVAVTELATIAPT
jgi:tetratricopeptide (TPR) repeat protein